MAQINTLIPKKKKGVLLTLGITFLALVVLTLATLILRNAETSEERLVELGGMDRIYNLGSSMERSLSKALYPHTGINITATNDTIIVERQMHPYPDNTLWNLDPNFFDYKLTIQQILSTYLNSVSKGTNFILETDPGGTPGGDRLRFFLEPSDIEYWLSTYNVSQADPPYPLFELNTGSVETNTTFHFLHINQLDYVGEEFYRDPQKVKKYTFYIRSTERNGIINWSAERTKTTTDPAFQITVNVIVDGPNGYRNTTTKTDIDLNGTGFTNVIYLDNLTGDRGCIPPPVGCKLEVPKRRPFIRFFAGASEVSEDPTNVSQTLLFANFNESLFTRMTLELNTTYTELYGSQIIQSQIPAFEMLRLRKARYL